jgi:hypothetical protein
MELLDLWAIMICLFFIIIIGFGIVIGYRNHTITQETISSCQELCQSNNMTYMENHLSIDSCWCKRDNGGITVYLIYRGGIYK